MNIEGDGACNHPVFCRKLHIRHIYVIIFGNGIEHLNEQPHFVDTFDSDGLLVGVGSGDVPGGRKKVLSVLGFMACRNRTLNFMDLNLPFQIAIAKHFVAWDGMAAGLEFVEHIDVVIGEYYALDFLRFFLGLRIYRLLVGME